MSVNNNWTREIIGSVIERYVINRLVGQGGTAAVFEATHQIIGRRVAIKILRPEFTNNAEIRSRFIKEAKLMASLPHPNIPEVITFEDQPKRLSIVMEYLEGEDLNKRIKREGPLPKDKIILIFDQVLNALQYVHENGVLLRDIKPSNIYILPGYVVKILDFGIAKRFGEGDGDDATRLGVNVGTPVYMSPEQVKADRSIDHRSDIYSLGITLYTACHGNPPFDINKLSEFVIFNKIVSDPLPDLTNDPYFRHLITRACQKDREKRFQSCSEWREELHHPVYEELPPTPDPLVVEKEEVQRIGHDRRAGRWNGKKRRLVFITFIIVFAITILFAFFGVFTNEKQEDVTTVLTDEEELAGKIYDYSAEEVETIISPPMAKARLESFYNPTIHWENKAPRDTYDVFVKVTVGKSGRIMKHEITDEAELFPDRRDYGIKEQIKLALEHCGDWIPAHLLIDTTQKLPCKVDRKFSFVPPK
ncbi:MAG: serine/threonine protein kinase [Bacteroidetes bacterium]|nr:serine/threonine protein kinase [Bacteroidota bacterium]